MQYYKKGLIDQQNMWKVLVTIFACVLVTIFVCLKLSMCTKVGKYDK